MTRTTTPKYSSTGLMFHISKYQTSKPASSSAPECLSNGARAASCSPTRIPILCSTPFFYHHKETAGTDAAWNSRWLRGWNKGLQPSCTTGWVPSHQGQLIQTMLLRSTRKQRLAPLHGRTFAWHAQVLASSLRANPPSIPRINPNFYTEENFEELILLESIQTWSGDLLRSQNGRTTAVFPLKPPLDSSPACP